ncbi:endo-1,4-beta-xylanase [Lentisphaera profundi]|uniref:Beta-xylanase n=1 Tax=Lentisphaera profundi TaxID=1658616 RepID=A0ABY7VWK8_9BACT|nr:endo-1,4-beta-xylanase [Lentisphaera profundi]WDE98477.1 endo-1,4-beta-xylanase [Lentisphaera profundi]
MCKKSLLLLCVLLPIYLPAETRNLSDYKLTGQGTFTANDQGFVITNKLINITHMGTIVGTKLKFDSSAGMYGVLKFTLQSMGTREFGRFRLLIKGQGKALLKKVIYCDRERRTYEIPVFIPKKVQKLELLFCVSKFIQGLSFEDLSFQQQRNKDFALVNPLTEKMWAYEGMDANAEWRHEANLRIEHNRKANLKIILEGKSTGLKIKYEMKKHAFPFGTAVRLDTLAAATEDSQRYKKELLSLFNSAVPGRFLKWRMWDNWPRSKVVAQLKWLQDQDLEIRGHALVWAGWTHLPKGLERYQDNKEKLDQMVNHHIKRAVLETKDLLSEWDVINEPYDNNDLMDLLGKDKMVEWFDLAHKLAPELELYINDYDILAYPGAAHAKKYFEILAYLMAQKTPFHGIGLQSHFKEEVTSPQQIYRTLNDLAQFNKKIKITEHDFISDSPEFQAAFMRDFLTVCFSHPKVAGINQWGFWEGAHWRSRAALFNQDWSERKNLKAYKALVFDEWWTRGEALVDEVGEINFRGFKGDYEIQVYSKDNKLLKSLIFTLTNDDSILRLRL